MTKERLLEMMAIAKKIEKEADQSEKAMELFSDNRNWEVGRTNLLDTFNFLDYDPRQLSDRSLKSIKVIREIAQQLWYECKKDYDKKKDA